MSHRPYIKDDDSGNISDLAIDAETLQGYKPCVNIVTLEDNNSTKEGTWLAKTNKVSALVDGQLFLYKITVAGASTTTLNITGSGGALGAKTVYRTGTTKLTTQYGVGHYILLAYNSLNTCFRLINDYDANSYAYVRQYQHGKNAAGATNLYPILTRYNLTNKNGKYDNAYARFYTDTYIDITNGYLYAPKVYSGGSEVAVKTDIPAEVTETTVSGWGFTKNTGTVTRVDSISPSSGNVSLSAVRYVSQSLTDDQKYQARRNIGAGTSSFTGYTEDNKLRPSFVNYPWERLLTPTILTGSPYVRITDITYSGTYRLSSGTTDYSPTAVYLRYNGATNNDYITILTNGPGGMDHPLDIALLNVYIRTIGNSKRWEWTLTSSAGFFTGMTDTSDGWFRKIDGTVTSVRVQAGTGLSSSVSTAQTGTLDTTISIASGYKLLTTSEYDALNAKQDKISGGTNGQLLSSNGSSLVWTNDNRGLLHHDLNVEIANTTTDSGWSMFNSTYNGYLLKSVRFNAQSPDWGVGNFGSGIVFGGGDTKGVMSVAYGTPDIKFAGGNGSGPKWWLKLTGTSTKTYDLDELNNKQDKISALGTATKPVYFSSDGVVSACLNYGGGTKVTLNGTEHKGTNATLYAPTTAGTSGYSLKSNGSGAPRWANEAKVQLSGTLSSGAKNNASVSFVITNTSNPLKKGVWRYSGTYGVFLIFAPNEITTMGSPKSAYICGYVSSSISNNTSLTLVEV